MTIYNEPFKFPAISHDSLASKSDIIVKGYSVLPGRNELIVEYTNNLNGMREHARTAVPRNLSRNRIETQLSEPMQLTFDNCALKNGSYEWQCTATELPDGYRVANYEEDDLNSYDGSLNEALITGQQDTASITFSDIYSDNGNNYGTESLNSMLLS